MRIQLQVMHSHVGQENVVCLFGYKEARCPAGKLLQA